MWGVPEGSFGGLFSKNQKWKFQPLPIIVRSSWNFQSRKEKWIKIDLHWKFFFFHFYFLFFRNFEMGIDYSKFWCAKSKSEVRTWKNWKQKLLGGFLICSNFWKFPKNEKEFKWVSIIVNFDVLNLNLKSIFKKIKDKILGGFFWFLKSWIGPTAKNLD